MLLVIDLHSTNLAAQKWQLPKSEVCWSSASHNFVCGLPFKPGIPGMSFPTWVCQVISLYALKPICRTLSCAETAHLLYLDLRIICDYAQTTYLKWHKDESPNHRPVEVGRYLWRSSGPILLLKQGHLKSDAQDHVRVATEYLLW